VLSDLQRFGAFLGADCEVYMVRVPYDGKPYRRSMMEAYGASVTASPSKATNAGRQVLESQPDSPGSLGIAISEAVEAAAASGGSKKYCLGSVLNHVLMHQTVIGLEAQAQFERAGVYPDVMVGCTGGGSSFGGFIFPFVPDKLSGAHATRFVAVEPTAAPSLTGGQYRYDFGDAACTTPLLKMHTLGHGFIPEPIHAGGLRYHGMSPLVSHIYELGLTEAVAIGQSECFAAALQFARTEGIVPAPEPTHALAAAIREALACKESGEPKTILTALCGHGHLDLSAYESYISGAMADFDLSDEAIAQSMASVPVLA